MRIRCTQKVLKLMGVPIAAVSQPPGEPDDWYMNLLWIGRRKHLLVTHAATLFSVFVPEVRKSDLVDLGAFVIPKIRDAIADEGFDPACLGVPGDTEVELARTVDRSVLGCMNDHAFSIPLMLERSPVMFTCARDINQEMNRRPMRVARAGDAHWPLDALRDRQAKFSGGARVVPLRQPTALADESPLIVDAVAEYLREPRAGLPTGPGADRASIVGLLLDSLDGYGHEDLTGKEQAQFRRELERDEERAFCRTFRASKIPRHADFFLGYFIIRKVLGPPQIVAAAGPVIEDFAMWLGDRRYISPGAARTMKSRARQAAEELPLADRLAHLLYRQCKENRKMWATVKSPAPDEVIEDTLAITRVAPGLLWFDGDVGPLEVPVEASALARTGWQVTIRAVRVGERWLLDEVGMVYPA
ncbi:MAG: DUF6933 domain-containing protein [Candidatus Dormibacteria bacterium]